MSPSGSADPEGGPVRFIVLVGLPGAGKSTVGPLVARGLGWRFVDLDAAIAASAGCSVPEIFATEGEPGFRARERAATREAATAPPAVIAAGGGWMVDRGNRALLGAGVLSVYLRVSPALALARMGVAAADRPLLRTPDPAQTLTELLARRESSYLQANHTLAVDSMPADAVAATIIALATGPEGD